MSQKIVFQDELCFDYNIQWEHRSVTKFLIAPEALFTYFYCNQQGFTFTSRSLHLDLTSHFSFQLKLKPEPLLHADHKHRPTS